MLQKFLLLFLTLFGLFFLYAPSQAYAATCDWTGAIDNKWSTNGNWSGCTTPTSGDTLNFDTGASNTSMNNDIAGLDNNAIFFFDGTYTLSGNSINDVVGLSDSGSETVTISLAFTGGPTSVVQYGPGTLTLNGNNTYTGSNDVLGGVLFINNSVGNSDVFVHGSSASINGTGSSCCVRLENGGKIMPGNNGTGIYTMENFIVDSTGGDTIIDLNGPTAGSGYDQILTQDGADLNGTLTINNTFTPVVGSQFTILNNTGEGPITGTFSNYPEGSTITAGGATFKITYAGGDGNDVVLTTLTSTPNSNPSSSSSVSNQGGTFGKTALIGPYLCTQLDPNSPPDLFQITYTNTTATLYFNPRLRNADTFQVFYGFTPRDNRYATTVKIANSTSGVQQIKINDLNPNTTYYFTIKSVNDCSSTKDSTPLKITTLPNVVVTPKIVYAY